MASTIQVIADLLRIDEQEAERFFREVQAYFEEEEVPEDGLIAQVIREHRTDNLTPEEVALIAKKRAKAKAERGPSSNSRPVRSQADRNAELDLNDGVQPINTFNRRAGDPREASDSLDKCPHGVSIGRPCHSCRRDGRRDL